ncbi:MAG: hypothetical protein M3N48_00200 [Verrucomicrobiota bacterium]|nr:hypothetical protein [Verrucomicrobiota bacterium]
MPRRKTSPAPDDSKAADDSPRPDVIVDFRFDQGLIYVALINLSGVPAYRVSVRFAKPFRGLGGDCPVSELPMFRRIEFLAPHKRIETLLDSSHAYFARREPAVIKAKIIFCDARRRIYQREIRHDLRIYKGISYVVNRDPAVSLLLPESLTGVDCAQPTRTEDQTYGHPKRQSLLQFQLPR